VDDGTDELRLPVATDQIELKLSDFIFNIAKGRVADLVYRVKANDPANSALVIALLAATGLETQSALEDADTFAAVVAGSTNEATNTGYARKVLTDSDLGTIAPNDTTNTFSVDIPDQTWTTVANNGTGDIGAFVVAYDSDTTGGTDANIIPLTHHTFSVTPDVTKDLTAVIAVGGFFVAS
jgi:hypothetical protein